MKILFGLFFGIVLFACQPVGPTVLKGKIDMGEQSNLQLYVRGVETDTLHVDEQTQEFCQTFDIDTPQVVRLFGTIGKGIQRFPIEQILYLEPGRSYDLQIVVQERKVVMTIHEKGSENKLLIDYNTLHTEKIGQFWKSNPSVGTFQDSLFQIYSESMKWIKNNVSKQLVKKHLEMNAYLSYFRNHENFANRFLRKGKQIQAQKYAQMPICFEVLDHPLALQFNDMCRCIYAQMQEKTKQPEEQILLLQEWFKTEAIRKAMKRYICQLYVDKIPYTDENYERLQKMLTDVSDHDVILNNYYGKRYAVKGAPCPDLVFEDKTGKQHRISDFKGKYVYIDVWASWCRPCCAEVPHMQKLEKELKNSNVVFVSISIDKDREAWLKKLKELNMHGNQWHAASREITELLNIKSIPCFLIYDKEGNLMHYKAPGPSSGEYLKKILTDLK